MILPRESMTRTAYALEMLGFCFQVLRKSGEEACIGRMSVEDRDDRALADMIPFRKNISARCIVRPSPYNRECRQMSHAKICGWFKFCGAAGQTIAICMAQFIIGALL